MNGIGKTKCLLCASLATGVVEQKHVRAMDIGVLIQCAQVTDTVVSQN